MLDRAGWPYRVGDWDALFGAHVLTSRLIFGQFALDQGSFEGLGPCVVTAGVFIRQQDVLEDCKEHEENHEENDDVNSPQDQIHVALPRNAIFKMNSKVYGNIVFKAESTVQKC